MTIIAAMSDGDRVIMGCDTRADYCGTAIYMARGKIITLTTTTGERVLLGVSGNSAIIARLQHHLKIDFAPNADGPDRWAHRVAEAATTVLAEATPPLVTPEDGSASSFDGTVLLAWRDRMWVLHVHGAMPLQDSVHTMGSGSEIGLGSLHTAQRLGMDPRKAVDLAVRLASTYNAGCGIDERGPMIHSTLD